jgi:hypothetical protein
MVGSAAHSFHQVGETNSLQLAGPSPIADAADHFFINAGHPIANGRCDPRGRNSAPRGSGPDATPASRSGPKKSDTRR